MKECLFLSVVMAQRMRAWPSRSCHGEGLIGSLLGFEPSLAFSLVQGHRFIGDPFSRRVMRSSSLLASTSLSSSRSLLATVSIFTQARISGVEFCRLPKNGRALFVCRQRSGAFSLSSSAL